MIENLISFSIDSKSIFVRLFKLLKDEVTFLLQQPLTINNNKSLFPPLSIINLTTINNGTISHFFSPRSPLSIFHRPNYLISRIIKMHHAPRKVNFHEIVHRLVKGSTFWRLTDFLFQGNTIHFFSKYYTHKIYLH